MVMERLRRLMFVALVALAGLGLSVAGCAPDFTDDECETNEDCFPNERCNQFGLCVVSSTSDAGPDTEEDAADVADTGDADDAADAEAVVDSVVVDPDEGTVQIGGTLQLDATAFDEGGGEISGAEFDWASDDEGVVTVDGSGEVTGVAVGTTTITATVDGISGEATIEVVEPSVDSVELNVDAVEMFVGESVDVDATAYDTEGDEITDAVFIWSTGDDAIATVNADGEVTGVGPGETTLTANSEGVEATVDVTVNQIPVDRVEIAPDGTSTIDVGSSSLDLDATAYDANDNELTGRDVEWTSEDDTVASVDDDGIVTGEAAGGPVEITATIDGVSASVDVVVEEANQPPTADAGSDVTVNVGETASLDASASTDPENDTLSFTWSLTAPATSSASLTNTSGTTTELTPDVAGDYVVELTADDGNGGMDTDTVTVTANGAPEFTSTAVTDVDQDSTYTYDITTNDPDGDAVTITAQLAGGGTLPGWLNFTDAGDGTATLTGTPTNADVGDYDIELTVDDGSLTATQSFTLTVNNVNDDPVASFTYMPPSPRNGQTVSLDASGSSDPDAGDAIASYDWVVTAPDTTTSNLTGETTSFTADQMGDWTVELTVTDGNSATGSTDQTISVAAANNPPTFTSTPVTTATEDSAYSYDVTTDDADGDSVTISAELQGGGTLPSWLTFTDAGDGTATLSGTPTNADVGDVDIELTVDDGIDTATQSFTITVDNVNDPPVASFTFTPTEPLLNDMINLDASGSSDPDPADSIASYDWVITAPDTTTTNLTGEMPSFTADEAGDWTVELTVTDGNSATDTTSQTVSVNTPPTADAGAAQTVTTGTQVDLDATGSTDVEDAFGDLSFSWTFDTDPSGGADALTDPNTATPSFTPSTTGDYILQVEVTDTDGASDTATVTITVN